MRLDGVQGDEGPPPPLPARGTAQPKPTPKPRTSGGGRALPQVPSQQQAPSLFDDDVEIDEDGPPPPLPPRDDDDDQDGGGGLFQSPAPAPAPAQASAPTPPAPRRSSSITSDAPPPPLPPRDEGSDADVDEGTNTTAKAPVVEANREQVIQVGGKKIVVTGDNFEKGCKATVTVGGSHLGTRSVLPQGWKLLIVVDPVTKSMAGQPVEVVVTNNGTSSGSPVVVAKVVQATYVPLHAMPCNPITYLTRVFLCVWCPFLDRMEAFLAPS